MKVVAFTGRKEHLDHTNVVIFRQEFVVVWRCRYGIDIPGGRQGLISRLSEGICTG
jgi:hypothetical protein